MKQLAIARHGHAAPFESEASDHQRPLSRRGWADVAAVGSRLLRHDWQPQLIVSSSAVRTLETARCLAQALHLGESAITVDGRLYQADVAGWLLVARELPPATDKVVLVGHNPGISNFAQWLLPGQAVAGFTPGSIVTLDLEIAQWSELAPGLVLRQHREAAREHPRT
jgi:phosphohistidine phosphatase